MIEEDKEQSVFMHIEITDENWPILAASAWTGYQVQGRGVVLTDVSAISDDESESGEESLPICYLSASSDVLRGHIVQNPQLEQWLKEYDPERSLILAFAFSFCVFYQRIDASNDFLIPAQAYEHFKEQTKDVLDLEQSKVLKEWPLICAGAKMDVSAEGKIRVGFSAPSRQELKDGIERLTENLKTFMLRDIKRRSPLMLAEERRIREGFEARLAIRWKKAFDLFETILLTTRKAGSEFNKKYREEAVRENDLVFDVLTRLHARACVIASEVLALIKSGHADGAQARWRSLHETAVIASFIAESGQEVAKRYLQHEVVESYKAIQEYQRYSSRLDLAPFSSEEVNDYKLAYQRLLTEYGKNFGDPYGWAHDALRLVYPSHKRAFTFVQLEGAVDTNHWRPYYRMSSHWVHAGPKSANISLGVKERGTMLLAGPSNTGLADPGQCACISLMQATVTLLSLKREVDTIKTIKALPHLVNEACDAFIEIQADIDRESSQQDEPEKNERSGHGKPEQGATGEDDGLDSFISFSRMEEAANFFLYESFEYIHRVAEYEIAGVLFGERIEMIEPKPGWQMPKSPSNFKEWLSSIDNLEVLDDTTLAKLAEAWHSAQTDAGSSERKLPKTHQSQSIDLVGHIINLSTCLESVINRHLFFLRESGELEAHLYASLDRTEVMPKLLFAFKDEITSKQLQTSRLRQLLRIRNQAVHFKASSTNSISLSFEDLIGIWRELSELFGLIRGEPTQEQFDSLRRHFLHKWLED